MENREFNLEFYKAWDKLNEAKTELDLFHDAIDYSYENIGIETAEMDGTVLNIISRLRFFDEFLSENNWIEYSKLCDLFGIYISYHNLLWADSMLRWLWISIWAKLRNIILKKPDKYTDIEGKSLDWWKRIQYYYNAFVTEEAVYADRKYSNESIEYGTTEEEHSKLYCDATPSNTPDFKNVYLKNVGTGKYAGTGPYTVEVKNYGGVISADKFTTKPNSSDREEFHNADLIVCYLLGSGQWKIKWNNAEAHFENVRDITFQRPHVNIKAQNVYDKYGNKFPWVTIDKWK